MQVPGRALETRDWGGSRGWCKRRLLWRPVRRALPWQFRVGCAHFSLERSCFWAVSVGDFSVCQCQMMSRKAKLIRETSRKGATSFHVFFVLLLTWAASPPRWSCHRVSWPMEVLEIRHRVGGPAWDTVLWDSIVSHSTSLYGRLNDRKCHKMCLESTLAILCTVTFSTCCKCSRSWFIKEQNW